jgi:hypothetical protein
MIAADVARLSKLAAETEAVLAAIMTASLPVLASIESELIPAAATTFVPPPVTPAVVEASRTNGSRQTDSVPREYDNVHRTAKLIALPMVVAGSSRAEVEQHLRRSLGLSDPEPVLDHVFGTSPARR